MPGACRCGLALAGPLAGLRVLLDRLIVFDDLALSRRSGAIRLGPLAAGQEQGRQQLADWMAFPGAGRTDGLARLPHGRGRVDEADKPRHRPGNEIFLSVCGLMASGAKTVLLSRWRTGGQSSLDLMREFTQELPHTTAADAWQRAVLVVTKSQLNLDAEPRIKKAVVDEPPKAKHPFFWAGYLLVDSGTVPPKVDIVAPGPAIKAKPAEVPPAKKP